MSKKQKESILKRQSVRFNLPNRSSSRKKLRVFKALFFVAVIVALTLVGRSFLQSYNKNKTSASPVKKEVYLSIMFEDDQKEDLALKNKIYKRLKTDLSKGSVDLKKTASRLKESFSLDWTHLMRISNDQYQVVIKRRLPALVLESSSVCLISHSKLVYDCDKASTKEEYPDLPRLKSEDRKDITHAVIAKAIEVLESSKKNNYQIEYIEAKLPRGFLIKLKNQSFMLFVGLTNFDKKFKRLSELVDTQKNIMPQIGLIELDYNNKAILKKRL